MNRKAIENAHKFAYLAQQYPEHDLSKLLSLFDMPPVDQNVMVWTAVDLGLVEAPNKETGEVKPKNLPKDWNFGKAEAELEGAMLYSFEKTAENETDLEEVYLSNWTAGYPAHDVLIATKRLLGSKRLFEYVITDEGSDYIFYTLYENRDKKWGAKQFKTNPLQADQKKQ